MPVEIEVVDKVIHRLETVFEPGFANLYGITYDSKILVVGFGFDTPSLVREYSLLTSASCLSAVPVSSTSSSDEENGAPSSTRVSRVSLKTRSSVSMPSNKSSYFDSRQSIYPAGIDHVGVLGIRNGRPISKEQVMRKLSDVLITDNPLYLEKDSERDELGVYYLQNGGLYATCFTVVDTHIFKEKFCFFNLLGNVSVKLPVRRTPSDKSFPEMQDLAKKISEEMIFRIGMTDIFISLNPKFNSLDSTVGKVFDTARKHKDFRTGLEVLNVYGFFPSSIEVNRGSTIYAPFVIDYLQSKEIKHLVTYDVEKNKFCINVELPFDGLVVVHKERSISEIYSLLIDAAERIIFLAELYINGLTAVDDPMGIQILQVHHFLLEELGHPVSLIYIPDEADRELEEVRRGIHHCLNLPLEKPLFKMGMALTFSESDNPPIPLMDVHIGLEPFILKSPHRRCSFVKGSYKYYHSAGLNDFKWGCSYRSLQTVISWFNIQGYTTKKIPDHKTIQEVFEESIKTSSGRQIGPSEVGLVLGSYLSQVSAVTLTVSSRSDVQSLGPTLCEHLSLHGSPVLLADGTHVRTLVGVDYDSSQLRLLLLDHDYNGEDDLDEIHKSGAVSWSSLTDDANYTFCLPQRPLCI